MESMATTRTSSRHRLLHTCGVVILTIAHNAYTISQNFNGPLGSIVRKTGRLAEVASPLIYAFQYQWLAILSLADNIILGLENAVETLFPPSNHLFNKIDNLVQTAETLPGKFDDALNNVPMIINQAPSLAWAQDHIILWLNFWISRLTHWGFENAKVKEIRMDSNSNECNSEPPSANELNKSSAHIVSANEGKLRSRLPSKDAETKKDVMKVTYKEALERGSKENGPGTEYQEDNDGKDKKWTKENIQNKDDGNMEEAQKQVICEEEARTGEVTKAIISNDPILELFESGWHMKSPRESKRNWMSSSVSYT